MYSVILIALFSASSLYAFAQRAQRLMIGVQTDLIKSDNDGFFEKMQGERYYYIMYSK